MGRLAKPLPGSNQREFDPLILRSVSRSIRLQPSVGSAALLSGRLGVSEAKAFAAGYATAIRLLTAPDPPRGGWCGNIGMTLESYRLAVETLEQCVDLVPGLFESWQLAQDPDFQESLAQMQRGEGVEIDFEELGRRNGESSQDV